MKLERDYILNNGLLERYVLGELSEEENQAVENAVKNDSELKALLDEIELSLEKMSLENSVAPPANIKSNLMQSAMHNVDSPISNEETTTAPERSSSNTRFLVAASIAGLLLLNSIWMYTQWQDSKGQFENLQAETETLKDQIKEVESQMAEATDLLETLNSPEVEKFILNGNSLSPNSVAIAYVNDNAKSVVVNCKGLAELGNNETYQMWADVDGEMIDMGVIPKGKDMVELNYIDHAESLNITIEPEGGNDHPTVERLITNVIL